MFMDQVGGSPKEIDATSLVFRGDSGIRTITFSALITDYPDPKIASY